MGLDMYLTGEAFYTHGHPNREAKPFPINETHFRLGYWRKHPNLHGYIVKAFADGVDECQEIALSADQLKQVIQAVKNGELPETTGFFFGESEETQTQVAHDVTIFEDALKWLETPDPGVWKSVKYRASW